MAGRLPNIGQGDHHTRKRYKDLGHYLLHMIWLAVRVRWGRWCAGCCAIGCLSHYYLEVELRSFAYRANELEHCLRLYICTYPAAGPGRDALPAWSSRARCRNFHVLCIVVVCVLPRRRAPGRPWAAVHSAVSHRPALRYRARHDGGHSLRGAHLRTRFNLSCESSIATAKSSPLAQTTATAH